MVGDETWGLRSGDFDLEIGCWGMDESWGCGLLAIKVEICGQRRGFCHRDFTVASDFGVLGRRNWGISVGRGIGTEGTIQWVFTSV